MVMWQLLHWTPTDRLLHTVQQPDIWEGGGGSSNLQGSVWTDRRSRSFLRRKAAVTSANTVITIAIRLRYDYDPTTTYRARLLPIRRKQQTNTSIFRRSRIVVESQL